MEKEIESPHGLVTRNGRRGVCGKNLILIGGGKKGKNGKNCGFRWVGEMGQGKICDGIVRVWS